MVSKLMQGGAKSQYSLAFGKVTFRVGVSAARYVAAHYRPKLTPT